MRAKLVTAPVWVQSVVLGVFFGVVMTLVPFGSSADLPARAVGGVLGGVFFGFFMGRFIKRDLGGTQTELKRLPITQRQAAMRAAWRGPAPTDPAVRGAALRNAENARDLVNRRWRFNTTVFGVALIAYAVTALTISPWWWLAFALFAGLLLLHLTSRRRIERRIAALASTASTPAE